MKNSARPLMALLLGMLLMGSGCDLGTYEQRTAEPMSSKMESNQPAPIAEGESETASDASE